MVSWRKSTWVRSSRLMVAPSLAAISNSSAGVSLAENMISLPEKPQRSAIISSVREEQSTPQPSSFSSFRIWGLGVAFTAKCSRKPAFQLKALCRRRAFSRMPFSSYRWKGVGYCLTSSFSWSRVTKGFFMRFVSFLISRLISKNQPRFWGEYILFQFIGFALSCQRPLPPALSLISRPAAASIGASCNIFQVESANFVTFDSSNQR